MTEAPTPPTNAPYAPAGRLLGISVPTHTGSPVFPGDTAYHQPWTVTLGPGCPANGMAITRPPHVGTRADALQHNDPEGDFELIALPFKLTIADASPVRAVLRGLCRQLFNPRHA